MRGLLLALVASVAIVKPVLAAPAVTDIPAAASPAGDARAVTVKVDTDSIKAVLGAVLDPGLTMAEALRVAALPGNQGLIRKARSYGRPGTDALFAKALMAAAHRDDAAADPGKFYFGPVRDRAARIKATLASNTPAVDVGCMAKIPNSKEVAQLFAALETEGSASLAGDVAAMPAGIDEASDKARKATLRNISLVGRSITILELSTHGLKTGAQVSYDDIYALGFYDDEMLYGLGYVMARAIAAEEGRGAIAELTGRPGALFVQRYRKLKSYGKFDTVPVLYAENITFG